MEKKLLIFDFDGVLEDTFDWNFEVARKRYGGIDKEDYRSWFCGNIYEHPVVLDAGPMNVEDYFKTYRKGFVGKRLGSEFKEVLAELSRRYILVIVSSICEEIIVPYLKRSGVSDLFGDVWGYQTDKSKVKKFGMFLEKYDVEAEDCFFITDTLGDILEANKVGIPCVGVSWGYHDKAILSKGNPVFIADDLSSLKDFLIV